MVIPLATLLQILAMAITWIAVFELNDWAFLYFDSAHVISWVFLPAALRLLGVMLLGWRGALGLFLGALATSSSLPVFGDSVGKSLALATLSALGPLVAVYLTMRMLRVPLTLHGLTPRQLGVFALVGAACNVVPHNLFFWGVGVLPDPFVGLVPMFVGDLLGIAIVMYALQGVLRVVERFVAKIPAP